MRSKKQPDGQGDRTFVDLARRAQLVECAIDAIAELGYQYASLAEIAKRAGITKGAIFYHFANRDELMHAVFTHVLTTGSEYILPRIQAAETPRAQLRAYVTAFVEAYQLDPKAVHVLYTIIRHLADDRERVTGPQDDRERVTGPQDDREPAAGPQDAELAETAIAALVDILRRGQESGEFGPFPVRSLALMMRATLEAIPTYALSYPDLDLPAYGQHLITFFERACGVRA